MFVTVLIYRFKLYFRNHSPTFSGSLAVCMTMFPGGGGGGVGGVIWGGVGGIMGVGLGVLPWGGGWGGGWGIHGGGGTLLLEEFIVSLVSCVIY